MSTPKNDGGPAFPQSIAFSPNGDAVTAAAYFDGGGMTLRDYLAAHAPSEVLKMGDEEAESARVELGVDKYDCTIHWPMLVAKRAYRYADAMIAERSK